MSARSGSGRSDEPRARAAGLLAAGVVNELVRPLRELREDLAVLVELLDRHMAEAKGPKGLTWKDVESLRQQLADNYLRSRNLTRLASELAEAIKVEPELPVAIDLNKLVESGLHLARHRVAADTEVFVDLGSLPLVRVGGGGELLLSIARLIAVAADSARQVEGSAISIKTFRDLDAELGEVLVVTVADNGGGSREAAATASILATQVAARVGGGFLGTSEPGTGSAFELRLPIGSKR